MSGLVEKIEAALARRKATMDECPVRKTPYFDAKCPTCRATAAGPCWRNVEADARFVDDVKEAIQ